MLLLITVNLYSSRNGCYIWKLLGLKISAPFPKILIFSPKIKCWACLEISMQEKSVEGAKHFINLGTNLTNKK